MDVQPGDDVVQKVNGAKAGDTICIHGPHYASQAILPKTGQRIVGVDADARISGGKLLTGWQQDGAGIWVWDAAGVAGIPHTATTPLGTERVPCYEFSNYQDDVFYDDQRLARVLTKAELGNGAITTPGQSQTSMEPGRFFFDYPNKRIYIDLAPTGHKLELASVDVLVDCAAGASDVVFQNLFLEEALSAVVDASGGCKGWSLEDCTIRFAHNSGSHGGSSSAAKPFRYLHSLITNNGQYGFGGGGTGTVIENCELSWNNLSNYRGTTAAGQPCGDYWGAGAAKFVHITGSAGNPGLQLLNLESHHNIGDGFWTDIGNQGVLVRGGRFHHNERNGYMHEISCDIEITGAEFDHNGFTLKNPDIAAKGLGIWLLDDVYGNVHDNVVHDNTAGGIALGYEPAHGMTNVTCDGMNQDATNSDKNNQVLGNDIAMCSGVTGGFYGGVTLASRNNVLDKNRYRVPDTTGKWWSDPAPETWTQWQTVHDAAGSRTTPCTWP